MEKLKAKHDHKLTDVLKVAIFGLMLILPGLILLPSMLYYGVNEYATAPTEQVEKIEYERVDFNQKIKNGNFINNENWRAYNNNCISTTFNNGAVSVVIDDTEQWSYNYGLIQTNLNLYETHTYIIKAFWESTDFNVFGCDGLGVFTNNTIYITLTEDSDYILIRPTLDNITVQIGMSYTINSIYAIDLTQMFGAGNEPTLQQFNTWYPNDYYEYTESRYEILEKQTGTYETYTDITSQIQYNWNSLWQQPLFSWTNYTILKQGLDNFTYVFGITQTSYINNLITYELIMVAIYIVIDIVLTLFKWLTHLIGEK